jgi:hypothetical protein
VEAVRKVFWVVGMAWVGAWTARIAFDYALGLDGTLVLVLVLAGAVVGGLIGWAGLDELEPWTLWDRRDAYLGWATFLGFVLLIACLFILPLPWSVLAAAAIAAVTLVVLRRAPPVPADAAHEHERV